LALVELAVVLSMQVLGGDVESAYLLGVASIAYCVPLYCGIGRRGDGFLLMGGLAALALVQLWLTSRVAWLSRSTSPGSAAVDWYRLAGLVVSLIGWGLTVALLVRRKRDLARGLAGLAAAAALALSITAVQVLPMLEYANLSDRIGDRSSQDIYAYSLRPVQILGWIWPNVCGTLDRGNRRWMETLPRRYSEDFWVPSVYLGGLALFLACGTAGFRDGPPWRVWLTGLVFLGIMGSLGEYASPLYWAHHRNAPGLGAGPADPSSTGTDPPAYALRDGDGGFYWLLTKALPGFESFRYPGKLLTMASLGLAGLAGLGWDSLGERGSRRTRRMGITALATTSGLLCLAWLAPASLRTHLAGQVWNAASAFGPLDVAGALSDIRFALGQSAAVLAVSLVLIRMRPARPRAADALALVLGTLDLIACDRRIVWTVPQTLFDAPPRLLEMIKLAERDGPAQGPFRIHRMPAWQPVGWFTQASEARHEEMLRWQRDTLQPLHGAPLGVEATRFLGSAQYRDQALLFGPSPRVADLRIASALKLKPGDRYVSYPRQSFDIWNTRYFILPGRLFPSDLNRGFVSFLPSAELLDPDVKSFNGPGGDERRARWLDFDDVRLLRNKAAFPRAWVVRQARFLKPITGKDTEALRPFVRRMARAGAMATNEVDAVEDDLRHVAWVETDHPEKVVPFLGGGKQQASETIHVIRAASGRVALDVDLQAPGVVVLADVYYPGWELTIDGQRAEILRINRMMRGAGVAAGHHSLVYTYRPASFRTGMTISLATLLVLAFLGCWILYGRDTDLPPVTGETLTHKVVAGR
jgi:hypothetical protein